MGFSLFAFEKRTACIEVAAMIKCHALFSPALCCASSVPSPRKGRGSALIGYPAARDTTPRIRQQ
jgi:hypothetical protein